MANASFQAYWRKQNYSGHRYSSPSFFSSKASEHYSILSTFDFSNSPIGDICCGFGEILKPLLDLGLGIHEAIDFSEDAVQLAQKTCKHHRVNIFHDDALHYIEHSKMTTLVSCQGVSQYLDADQLSDFITLFMANNHAQNLVLYDTVDPLRWSLSQRLIRYESSPLSTNSISTMLHTLYSAFSVLKCGLSLKNKSSTYLGNISLGYGYLPSFFAHLAHRSNLFLQFRSSAFFEYRYHVIMSKLPLAQYRP